MDARQAPGRDREDVADGVVSPAAPVSDRHTFSNPVLRGDRYAGIWLEENLDRSEAEAGPKWSRSNDDGRLGQPWPLSRTARCVWKPPTSSRIANSGTSCASGVVRPDPLGAARRRGSRWRSPPSSGEAQVGQPMRVRSEDTPGSLVPAPGGGADRRSGVTKSLREGRATGRCVAKAKLSASKSARPAPGGAKGCRS